MALNTLQESVKEMGQRSSSNVPTTAINPLLGYEFNECGQLRDANGQPFDYTPTWKSLKRKHQLAQAVAGKVHALLETRCKLLRLNIPLGVADSQPHSFIFVSQGALTTTDRLLVLIHGSGVVRAGMWSLGMIMTADLTHGTQIPYIERAIAEGYEVIVLNSNMNQFPDDLDHGRAIPGSEDPESHGSYVWDHIVLPQCKARHIAIVAHSYGGVVTSHLLDKHLQDFRSRVFAVALTDSVHGAITLSREVNDFFQQRACNFVPHKDIPVGQPLASRSSQAGAQQLSAGDVTHEKTSHSSFNAVFDFLQQRYLASVGHVIDRTSRD